MAQGIVKPAKTATCEVFTQYPNGNRGKVYELNSIPEARMQADKLAAVVGGSGEVQIWQVERRRLR